MSRTRKFRRITDSAVKRRKLALAHRHRIERLHLKDLSLDMTFAKRNAHI